ncbi:MAG TPA: ATP-binding protein [Solirubrobacteraceae bacterium]|nr:ATP-binding protein [Solirubrobacteraceae bacterium]
MTEDISAVRLEMESRPEAPALVRAALTGVAQRLDLDPELFDDLKTAVSEACNNVVLYAYNGQPGPLAVALDLGPEGMAATIRDWGRGIGPVEASEERMGVGLAVISALADRAEFISAPDGGTEVRMAFAGGSGATGALERVPVQLSGDVVVTVWPVSLLTGVLGRITRAVAGRTHLSVDRFSDIYLVTDAIAGLAGSAAGAPGVTFAVTGSHQRLELVVGPFRAGNGERLLADGLLDQSPVLSECAIESVEGFEFLRVVLEERGD